MKRQPVAIYIGYYSGSLAIYLIMDNIRVHLYCMTFWQQKNILLQLLILFLPHQQASECLEEHTARIRSENKRLRAELKQLIETTNDLQLQKKRLSRQYNTLLREHQLNEDLQRLSVYGTRSVGGGGRRSVGGKTGGTLPDIISSPCSSSVLQWAM